MPDYTLANTTWPSTFNTGRVRARYELWDGSPAQGTVVFTPRPSIAIVANESTIVVPVPITVALDSQGRLTDGTNPWIDLPATDDPDVQPGKFTYEVTENITGAANRAPYDFALPAGSNLDLLANSPVQASIGFVNYLGPPGPPGPD